MKTAKILSPTTAVASGLQWWFALGSLPLIVTCLVIAQVVLTPVTAWGATPERKVALVMGNSDYRFVPPLTNPKNDADAVAETLARLDFDVIKVVNVGIEDTRATLARFGERIANADVGLFFYAGHGVQVQGESYLLPTDVQPQQGLDLAKDALTVSEVHAVFQKAGTKVSLVVLDACRDDPFSSNAPAGSGQRGIANAATVDIRRGLAPMTKVDGMLVAYAAAPGEVAQDGDGGNSPFTAALLQWIDRPGLETSRLFRRVRQNVIELTAGSQIPWVEDALATEFYFRQQQAEASFRPEFIDEKLWETVQLIGNPEERRAALRKYVEIFPEQKQSLLAEGQLEILDQTTAAPLTEDGDIEGSFWLAIRDSGNPSDYQDYLTEWPNGVFADAARERLGRLGETSQVAALQSGSQNIVVAANQYSAGADDEGVLGLDTGHIQSIQDLLTELGFYNGAPTGEFDSATRAAVRLYQQALGRSDTGYFDGNLLRLLVNDAVGRLLLQTASEKNRTPLHELAAIALKGRNARPTIIRWNFTDGTPEVQNHWRAIVEEYEAINPTVDVRMEYMHHERYKTTLLANLASSAPPHILKTWGGGHIKALVDSGFIRDLSGPMAENWALAFKPGALQNFTLENQIYGVPMRITLSTLWYNKALFRQAGVEANDVRTWEDFLNAVRSLKAAGITPLSVGGTERWPLQLLWGNLALRAGGEVKFRTAYDGVFPGFGDPAFVKAGEMMTQLTNLQPFTPDYLSLTPEDSQRQFAQGQAAMTLDGDWMLTGVEAQWQGGPKQAAIELGRINFPGLSERDRPSRVETYGGVTGWAVSQKAPEEAVDFLRYFVSSKHQRGMAARGFLIPVIDGADEWLTNPIQKEIAKRLDDSEYHQLFYDQALGIQAGEVVNTFATLLATGRVEPEDAAAAVQQAWQRQLTGTSLAAN